MWEVLLSIFGFLGGIAASMVEIGGGAFFVPILHIQFQSYATRYGNESDPNNLHCNNGNHKLLETKEDLLQNRSSPCSNDCPRSGCRCFSGQRSGIAHVGFHFWVLPDIHGHSHNG